MTTQTTFGNPTQYKLTKITIDGQDVIGLFFSLSIFENLYIPAITGNIIITDTDGATGKKSFIEEENIEWLEEIEFSLTNAEGEELEFKGVLNGLKNEVIKGQIKMYTAEFTSKEVRKNEQTYVTKRFLNVPPQDIVKEMIEDHLEGELDKFDGKGRPMQHVGCRRRPVDIIKYVLTHGVPEIQDAPQATDKEDNKKEDAKGRAGFLCWQTINGWRFNSISDVLAGNAGEKWDGYQTTLVNRSLSMKESMKCIINYEFKRIGDFQTKLRSGAFAGVNCSFDMDKGIYKEYKYYNETCMTDKQKEALPEDKVTRYFFKPFVNDKFENSCERAQPNTGDQSRLYLEQNTGSQNTFSDQIGTFTLPFHPEMHAGDTFDCKINKVKSPRSEGGADQKHSGRYIMESVSHHITTDGRAYTKIKSLRFTKQQNDATSEES